MRHWYVCLFLVALFAGCDSSRPPKNVDNDFETEFFKKAKSRYELRDFDGSIQLFEEVLRDNPNMAKAHLELGLIYGDRKGDYASAIYHYKKYLKLKPTGEKSDVVRQLIPRAELAIASAQPNSPIESASELAREQKNNLELKSKLEEAHRTQQQLEKQIATLKSQIIAAEGKLVQRVIPETKPEAKPEMKPEPKPVAVAVAEPVQPIAAPTFIETTNKGAFSTETNTQIETAKPAKTHTVRSGETIWRIATIYYPGSAKEGEKKILEANKASLSDPTKLKIGQILVIP